ncbi:non-canonical purine NTP pyrophosphatase [Nanoarchaeota archaeon]
MTSDNKTIHLVTHNPNKVREFKLILEPKVNVEQVDFDYLELRSDDPEEIAKLGAKQMADKYEKIIVVEDSGFFIEKLDGFPGTCSAYVHKKIGLKGIIALMKNFDSKEDRKCQYKSAIGFCEPCGEPRSFLGTEKGIVANEIHKGNGWGHDPIFIPLEKDNPDKKTYAEIKVENDISLFRRKSLEKLKEYLLNNKD